TLLRHHRRCEDQRSDQGVHRFHVDSFEFCVWVGLLSVSEKLMSNHGIEGIDGIEPTSIESITGAIGTSPDSSVGAIGMSGGNSGTAANSVIGATASLGSVLASATAGERISATVPPGVVRVGDVGDVTIIHSAIAAAIPLTPTPPMKSLNT